MYDITKKQTFKIVGLSSNIKIMLGILTIACILSCTEKNPASTDSAKNTKSNNVALAYDLNDPKDQFLIFQKLQGDISGKKTYFYSKSRVFGIRPDKSDSLNVFGKEVLKSTGCRIKISRLLKNGNVETKSRSWLLYQDPKTREFIDSILNPYTGEEVEVPLFRAGIRGTVNTPNGPIIDTNFKMESTALNAPMNLVFEEIAGRMHVTRHAFTKWFENKSQTWRTEMTLDTYDFDKKYLTDRSHTHIPSDYHWTSQISWLSILKMGGTPGHMIWSSNGSTLDNKDDIPTEFIAKSEEKYPGIFSEPLKWDEE